MMNNTTTNNTIYALAAAGDTLYAARPSGVYRSTDGGQTWQNAFESTPDLRGIAATALSVQGSTVFAGVNGGIAISADGGTSWQVRGLAAPPPVVMDITGWHERILVATADDGVFLSDDSGTTWAAWNFGLIDLRVNCMAIAPDATVFAGTESGLVRSHNGGKSWRDLTFPVNSAPVLSLAFAAGYIFAGTQTSGILYADPSGTDWAAVPELDALKDQVIHALLPGADNLLILTDRRLIRLATIDLSHQVLHQFLEREALALTPTDRHIAIGFADGSVEIIPLRTDQGVL